MATPNLTLAQRRVKVQEALRKWQKNSVKKRKPLKKLALELGESTEKLRKMLKNLGKSTKKARAKLLVLENVKKSTSARQLHNSQPGKVKVSYRSCARARKPKLDRQKVQKKARIRKNFVHPSQYQRIFESLDFDSIYSQNQYSCS